MLAVGWWKVWKRVCKQHGRWHLKPWCPTGDPVILQTPWVPRAAPCKGIWGEDGLCWDWVNPACFAVFSRLTLLQAGVCPCPEGQAVDGQRGLSPGQLRDERVAASAASALQLSCSSAVSHFSQEGAT